MTGAWPALPGPVQPPRTRPQISTSHATPAAMAVTATIALPQSFAFPASGCDSSVTKSTTASIAVFASSAASNRSPSARISARSAGARGSAKAATADRIFASVHCLRDFSLVQAACQPFQAGGDVGQPGAKVASKGRVEGVEVFAGVGDEQGDVETTVRQLSSTERFLCLVLTSEDDIRLAIEAMKAGAADCLIYPCPEGDIQKSVDNALNQIREHIAEHSEQEEAKRQIERLTSRERDVLFGLMRGKSNKMIAIDLEISPRTVEIYRAHLMEKLGAHSLSDTLKVAFAAGLN